MWCFAKVNSRLAEIFFEKDNNQTKIIGHFYVKKSDYKTKQELRWIEEDTRKFDLSFRNSIYRDKNTGKKYKLAKIKKADLAKARSFEDVDSLLQELNS